MLLILVSYQRSALSASRRRSALPLLVLLVRADHAHHTAAADHLALVTNPFDRRSHLHDTLSRPQPSFSTIRPRVRSRADSSSRTRSPISTRMKFRPGPLGTCAVT